MTVPKTPDLQFLSESQYYLSAMARKILLLGRKGIVVDDAKAYLTDPDLEIFAGTGIDDLRATFSHHPDIKHVFMGAGIDLEIRLDIVRETFHLSQDTSVHMKDASSGRQGFLSFVKAILEGLRGAGL